MPKIGMRLRVRLGSQLPLDLIPEGEAPELVGTPYVWLRSDSGISTDTGVDVWTCKAGTGRTATQGTGALQPLLQTGGLGGFAYLQFDGADDWLNTDAWAGDLWNSDITVYAVLTHRDGSGQNCLFSIGYSGSPGQYMAMTEIFGNLDVIRYNPQTTLAGANTFSTGNNYRVAHRYDHTNIDLRVEGTDETPVAFTADPANTSDVSGIGVLRRNSLANYLQMDLYEFIVYDSALSDADLDTLDAYAAARYGI